MKEKSKSNKKDSQKQTEESLASKKKAYFKQRSSFKTLLLTNPNYFGNLKESEFNSELSITGNTFYEELACVGYHPQQEQLEGVVYVYQSSGYGTDICGAGTPEYVRFYLTFDGGSTWQDQGLTSFQSYNIPEGTQGRKRLEYAVSLKVDPKQKLCFFDSLIQVRAILSWNNPPPANQPNWTPVWGNVEEATVQVEPRRFIFPPDIFEPADMDFPPQLKNVIDVEEPIQTKTKALSVQELAEQYDVREVPVHRFAYKEISNFVSAKTNLSAGSFKSLLPDIKIDPDILDLLFPETDGNTSFEELTCIGLDPNSPNTLVGIIKVKKSSGYSGGPCTDGSREYVTFWADFDGNGSFETCLGTANVRVYDLNNIPSDGVYYAARLPVDLDEFRKNCKEGPTVVRIRAILSWNVPVSCADPNKIPTWGNREETLINISPVAGAPAGKIAILGGIPVSQIYDSGHILEGQTTPDAVFATNNLPPDNPDGDIDTADGRPCPFGGRVTVQGAPLLGHSYKVEVTPAGGGAPTTVVTELTLTRWNGTTHMHNANPATLRFDYLPFTENINSVLAQWDTTGDDKWEVKLSTYDGGGNLVGTDTQLIQLDNTGPDASITINTGSGDCGKFKIGDVLSGTFVARDKYLSHYGIHVIPNVNPPGVGVPSPSSGIIQTPPAPGDTWTLDTTDMKSCGYVIRVVARDRAIINSQSVGHHASDSAGFCLEEDED